MRQIALVISRYGEDVVGGVERLARGFAETIAALPDWSVTVLTSCARKQDVWENFYADGVATINGVKVRRFPVTPYDARERDRLNRKFAKLYRLPTEDQYAWVQAGEQCEALYRWLAEHSAEFSHIITLPYLSTVGYQAAWIAPEKTIMWPCLHDELYAFMEPFRLLMESVAGVLYISPEEGELARNVLRIRPKRQLVLGIGVELDTPQPVEQTASTPYLLYLGRLNAGKNVHVLYDFAQRYFDEAGGVQLAVAGRGALEPPDHPAFVFHGHVDEQQKANLIAGSLAVCQPSLMESFSLVMMEAWLAGRPALVNAGSPVTAGHVQRAKGGLSFDTYADYKAAVAWLLENADLAAKMGVNGRDYVEANYRWSHIVNKLGQQLDSPAWAVGQAA